MKTILAAIEKQLATQNDPEILIGLYFLKLQTFSHLIFYEQNNKLESSEIILTAFRTIFQ